MCCGKNREQLRMQTPLRPANPAPSVQSAPSASRGHISPPALGRAPVVQPALSAPRGPNSTQATFATARPYTPLRPRLNIDPRSRWRPTRVPNAGSLRPK
jgi:hypothetical protein